MHKEDTMEAQIGPQRARRWCSGLFFALFSVRNSGSAAQTTLKAAGVGGDVSRG